MMNGTRLNRPEENACSGGSGWAAPPTTGRQATPLVACASITADGDFARRQAVIVAASVQPMAAANDRPRVTAVSWLITARSPMLWTAAGPNTPRGGGEGGSQQTDPAPADWPA